MASDSSRAVGSGLGPGTVLDGKYEILTRIGAGGMGEVFKARHLHLNAFRCIKVMKQELLADEVFRSRFLREARLATQIHHPNIAVVHDFFIGEGGNYMVTEFIDGRTLRQWGSAHGPFPLPLAADIASQVLAGLDHIHRRGLLHRDVSPDNVMLSFDADDRLIAKIIDLGIAKDVGNTAAADTTQVGMLIGNPKYMSPEQLGLLADGEQLDGRADLYCLGVVLYEMLLGVPPFVSETPHGYIMKHLTQAPRRFSVTRPGCAIPDRVEDVIFRALEKDRTKRYGSAREFAAALAPFLEVPPGTLMPDDIERIQRGPGAAHAAATHDAPTESQPVDDESREVVLRAEKERAAEDAFQRAWEAGRSTVWREFLKEYGDTPRAEEANRLLEEAVAFESATASASETAVREFLFAWPDARHHMEAGILLAKLKEEGAQRRAYDSALATNTSASWARYLSEYPKGAHAGEARDRIRAFEREAAASALRLREPHDWDAAWEAGTSEAWDQYLDEHPDSPRISEARSCRQEAHDFEVASAANIPAMWRAFIKTWPGGRHRMEAEIRVGK